MRLDAFVMVLAVLWGAASRQAAEECQRQIDAIEREMSAVTTSGRPVDEPTLRQLTERRRTRLNALLRQYVQSDSSVAEDALTPAALIYERLMDYPKTIECASRAIANDRSDSHAIGPLVRALLNSDLVGEAHEALDRYCENADVSNGAREFYGIVYEFERRKKSYQGAAASLDAYLEYSFRKVASGTGKLSTTYARLEALRQEFASAEIPESEFRQRISEYSSILEDGSGNGQLRFPQRAALVSARMELAVCGGDPEAGKMVNDAIDLFIEVGHSERDSRWAEEAELFVCRLDALPRRWLSAASTAERVARLLDAARAVDHPSAAQMAKILKEWLMCSDSS